MRQAFIGVDVGTSSARAGVFDERGTLLATARHPITVWHETGNVVEQSSSEIWLACAAAVRGAMAEASLPPSAVKGLGFDATCSLVVLDKAGQKGTGKWTSQIALDLGVPIPTIDAAIVARILSSQKDARVDASNQIVAQRVEAIAFQQGGDELGDELGVHSPGAPGSRLCAESSAQCRMRAAISFSSPRSEGA